MYVCVSEWVYVCVSECTCVCESEWVYVQKLEGGPGRLLSQFMAHNRFHSDLTLKMTDLH